MNEPPLEVKPPVSGLLPEAWQRVFNKVLAKSPADRYSSCTSFVRDLLEAATELDPRSRTELLGQLRQGAGATILPTTLTRNLDEAQTTSPGEIQSGSKGMLYGGIVAGLVVLGLGFFLFSGKGGEETRIITDPPGATILMNGHPIDDTKPLILKGGEKVQLQKRGFVTADYVHKPGDKAPRIELKPVISEVRLETDPSGAAVVLDSRNQGQLHDLTFTQTQQGAGLSTRFEVGETPGDKIYKLLPLNETRTTGEVKTIDPNAPGTIKFAGEFTVRVKADGKDLGDVAKVNLPPGSHKLELVNPTVFYKDSRTVTVAPGQTVAVNLPGLAKLTVSTFPTSGAVVVDGTPSVVESDGSASISLVKGKHTISIQGRAGSSRSVEVDKETQELSFKI